MTNSSPQDPQNPIPERRKRPAAGVTFDEMIAIIVAFSTIGTILFWSLGSKKGGIADNFNFGRQSSSLSGKTVGLGLSGVNADSDMKFGELESKGNSFSSKSSESSGNLAAESRKFVANSSVKPKSYELAKTGKLAPLGVGAAAIPALSGRNNNNRSFNSGNAGNAGNTSSIVTGNPNKTDPQATAPDSPDNKVNSSKTDPQATAPDSPDSKVNSSKTDPQATTPDSPDSKVNSSKTDPQTTTPEKVEIPDDVAPSYWAYPFVKQMSDQALVADLTEDQNFEPDKLITRGAMATLISQAFDSNPTKDTAKQFDDVTSQDSIATDVDKAVRMGFMRGYSDNEFRPSENIPRYQVLVTLATGLGLQPSQDAAQILQKFGDGADMPDWAKQQVAAAVESGLAVNRPNVTDSSLSPNESATRGEVAAMIHQALVQTGKLQPLESEYILKP